MVLLGGGPSWWLWKQRIEFRPVWSGLGIRLLVIVATTAVVAGSTLTNYQQMASLLRNHRELRFAILACYACKRGTTTRLSTCLPAARGWVRA